MDHKRCFLGTCSGDDDLILSLPVVGTSGVGVSPSKSNQLTSCNSKPRSGFDNHTALQSTWIQRLKPTLPLNQREELPIARKCPGKDAKVWTHFSKDFRSCRGSNTACQSHSRTHSCSTTWPLLGGHATGLNFENASTGPTAQDPELPLWTGGDADMVNEDKFHSPRGNPFENSFIGETKLGVRTRCDSRICRKSPILTEELMPCVQEPSQEKHPQTESSRVDIHFSSSVQERHVVTGIKLTGLHTKNVAGAVNFAATQNAVGFGPLWKSIGKPSLSRLRSATPRAGFTHISDGLCQEGQITSKAEGGWPSPVLSRPQMLDKEGASADADIMDSGLPVGIIGCEPIGSTHIKRSSPSSEVPAKRITFGRDLEAVTVTLAEGRDSLNKFLDMGGRHQYSDHSNKDVLIQSTNRTSTYVKEDATQRVLIKDPHALDFIRHEQAWLSSQTDTINNCRENIFCRRRHELERIESHSADHRAAGPSGVSENIPKQTSAYEIQGTASCNVENTDSLSAKKETKSAHRSSPQGSFISPYTYERETESKGKLARGVFKDSNEGKAVQEKPFESAKQQFELLQNTNFLDMAAENRQEIMSSEEGDIALADEWNAAPQTFAFFEDMRQPSKPEEETSSTASFPWEDLLVQYNQSCLTGNAKAWKSDLVDKLERKASRSSVLYKKDLELKPSRDSIDCLNPSCLEDDAVSSMVDKDNHRSMHHCANTNNIACMDLFWKQEKPMHILERQNQNFDDMDGYEEEKHGSQLDVCGRRVQSRHRRVIPVTSNTGKVIQNIVPTCSASIPDLQKHLNSVREKDKLFGSPSVGLTELKLGGVSRELANVKEAVSETCFEQDSRRKGFCSEKNNTLRCSEGMICQSEMNFTEREHRQEVIKYTVQKSNGLPDEGRVSTSVDAGHTRPVVLAESRPGCELKVANAVNVSASHGWLQRWLSQSTGSTSSKFPRSFINCREKLQDKLAVKASTGSSSSALFICTTGRVEVLGSDCVGKSQHTDQRCIETTGLPLCSSQATTKNLVELSQSMVNWQDHRFRPSAAAMAMVATASRQIQPPQTLRRGAVSLWPSLESATPAVVVENQDFPEFAEVPMKTWEPSADLL